jgi:hypothetical protein
VVDVGIVFHWWKAPRLNFPPNSCHFPNFYHSPRTLQSTLLATSPPSHHFILSLHFPPRPPPPIYRAPSPPFFSHIYIKLSSTKVCIPPPPTPQSFLP